MFSHVAVAPPAMPNHTPTSTQASGGPLSVAAGAPGTTGIARPNPPAVTVPPPIPPFQRIDTHEIKQKLHDTLGEHGLPYWQALSGYLLGQVGRDELASLVRSCLKGEDSKWHFFRAQQMSRTDSRPITSELTASVQLHNQLLKSLLHNASSPQIGYAPTSPLNMHKRRRGDNVEIDTDGTFIEPMDRVRNWVMGMGLRERERVRKSVREVDDEEADGEPEASGDWDVGGSRKRKWSVFQSSRLDAKTTLTSAPTHPPLAQGSHVIPSSHQLGSRLSQVAKPYGLDVSPEQQREVGEFMGVGLSTHLGDVLHSVVHLTGRDRPGEDTMRVPLGTKSSNMPEQPRVDHPVPKPDLQTLKYLFTLTPGLQPQISPTIYKLQSGLTTAELENMTPPKRKPVTSNAPPSIVPQPPQQDIAASPTKAASAIHAAAGQGKMDAVSQTLADTGLLKIDKAGHDHGSEGERKREKKHNLHWKYEDPAIILKDLLG